jgi:hypothetical protein
MGFIRWALVSKAMNFRVPNNIGYIVTCAAGVSEEIQVHRSEYSGCYIYYIHYLLLLGL